MSWDVKVAEATFVSGGVRSWFNPNEPGHFPIRMDLSEEWRIKRLFIEATYAGLKRPLSIRPADAQFKVTMAKGEPAIRFDPATGEIGALRIGHALIETSYGGLHQTTCVLVTEFNAYASDRSSCEELRQAGEPEQSWEQAAASGVAAERRAARADQWA
jgi:hypothetical protein